MPQVLCVSEHHLCSEEINNIKFSPYILGAQYCRQHCKMGGVAIFVTNNIKFNTIDLEQFSNEKDLEACALRISLAQKNLIIVCIYRSPTGDFKYFIKQLEVILNKIYKAQTYIILCGDFNINHLVENNRYNQLQSLLASYNLFSTVTFPTRITSNTSTLIDNIYVNVDSSNYKVSPLTNGLSDHDAQIMEILNLNHVNPKKHYDLTRKIDNNTILNFINLLSYENWEEVFLDENVNLIFNNFLNNYLRIFNASFPIIKRKKHMKPNPWLTSGIKISCATKRYLYVSNKHNSNPSHKIHYKKYCKILSSVIKEAKRMYYDSRIQKADNKAKATWDIIKTVSINKTSNKKAGSGEMTNTQKTADAFNLYFSEIAEHLTEDSVKNNSYKRVDPLINLKTNLTAANRVIKLKSTTTHEIDKVIHSLKTKDSHGYNGISTRILKLSAPYIVSPITFIINKMLSSGIYPDRLKYSEVKPLFKSGNATDLAHYRPISLLTSFSKIFEKLIHQRLYYFFDQQNILIKEQHGFRENMSTETDTFSFFNSILEALDSRKTVGGLFLDLRKAFDCVDHDILLTKLKFYGISGKSNKLMESYLKDRFQRVVLNDKFANKLTSEWRRIKHGVPQGSILGPLLFLIYINDLPRTLDNYAVSVLFADDTSIIISNTNVHEYKRNLKLAIHETNNWFANNLLTVNYNKTHFLQFFTKKRKEVPFQIVTANSLLINSNSTKFLGVTIDSMLTWKEHIMDLSGKLNKAIFAIRAVKTLLSSKSWKMVYHSYFHSVMSYGIIFWGTSPYSNNVLRIQKRIIRIITNSSKQESCRQLYKQQQILTVYGQYIFSLLMFVVKHREVFSLNSDIHDRNTRYNLNLHFPTTNLKMVQRGAFYSGVKIFNHLPTSIKALFGDPERFKIKLRNFLLEHSLYSLDEYFNINPNETYFTNNT